MDGRQSFFKRLSDAFLPDPIRRILFVKVWHCDSAYVNGWSFVHLLSGVLVGWLEVTFWQALLIHTAWELLQVLLGDNTLSLASMVDTLMDLTFFMVGWFVAMKLR